MVSMLCLDGVGVLLILDMLEAQRSPVVVSVSRRRERSVRSHCCTGGALGSGGVCFLNVLVARRKLMSASMLSLVPRTSDVSSSSPSCCPIAIAISISSSWCGHTASSL